MTLKEYLEMFETEQTAAWRDGRPIVTKEE